MIHVYPAHLYSYLKKTLLSSSLFLFAAFHPAFAYITSPDEGLIGYFPFNPFYDGSTHGLHTNANAPIRFVDGIWDQALFLDGSYTLCYDDTDALKMTTFSISAWIYSPKGRPTSDIVQKGKCKGYWLYIEEGKVIGGFRSGTTYLTTSALQLQEMTWYNITLTYDGSYLRLYVDGYLEGLSYAPHPPRTNMCSFKIGSLQSQYPYADAVGIYLEELTIYDFALNKKEIQGVVDEGLIQLSNLQNNMSGL